MKLRSKGASHVFRAVGVACLAIALVVVLGVGCGEKEKAEKAASATKAEEAAPKAAAAPGSPEEEVKATLNEMVSMMETGTAKECMERFLPPKTYDMLKETGLIDMMAEEGGPEEMAEEIEQTKAMLELTPAFNEDKTKATFTIPESGEERTLQKIDDKWYVYEEEMESITREQIEQMKQMMEQIKQMQEQMEAQGGLEAEPAPEAAPEAETGAEAGGT